MLSITKKEMKALLHSQQGELDGVEMYKALARTGISSKNRMEVF